MQGNGGGNVDAGSRRLKNLYTLFYMALVVGATIVFTSATYEQS
jgi:hypothetical protein